MAPHERQTWIDTATPNLRRKAAGLRLCPRHNLVRCLRHRWLALTPSFGMMACPNIDPRCEPDAQYNCRDEHQGRCRQIDAGAGAGRNAVGPARQDGADHRQRRAGQRQRHADDGGEPAQAAIQRPDHRRSARPDRAAASAARLGQDGGRRRLRRR